MKIDEINNRIAELSESVELLTELKNELETKDDALKYVRALEDGIQYTKARLEEYESAEWIMDLRD